MTWDNLMNVLHAMGVKQKLIAFTTVLSFFVAANAVFRFLNYHTEHSRTWETNAVYLSSNLCSDPVFKSRVHGIQRCDDYAQWNSHGPFYHALEDIVREYTLWDSGGEFKQGVTYVIKGMLLLAGGYIIFLGYSFNWVRKQYLRQKHLIPIDGYHTIKYD